MEKLGRRRVIGAMAVAVLSTAVAWPVAAAEYTKDNPLKVVIVLDGTRGDKSFLDSAVAGVTKATNDMPVTAKVIEGGYDPGKWQPTLADAADGDYDVVICGTFNMSGFLADLAPQYPDKHFILYDDTVDFASGKFPNVMAIQFRTQTAGYLAGYAAAKVSKTGTLATILGMEIPAVTGFKEGFDEGAKAARPDVKILNSVAGVFNDPAKGKEIALAQISQGADVIFPIAGATGVGSLQAVRDQKKLAVGVDSDQATIFAATDPAQADVIMTSVEKNVGQSLYLALKETIEGTAPYGKENWLGLKEGAVAISKNAQYENTVPAHVRTEVDDLAEKIIGGELKILGTN